MTLPTARDIDPVISATWPAARNWTKGLVSFRNGGGGQRATAATVEPDFTTTDIAAAEQEMLADRGHALFRVRNHDGGLDDLLGQRGYTAHDVTNILVMPAADLASQDLQPVSAFMIWPPLAIIEDMWHATGTGPDRQANMHRVTGPKSAILGRGSDQPGGVGFVAAHDQIAMIHAVAVEAALRRQKIAQNMMIAAARWALDVGAPWLTTLCTAQNAGGNEFYHRLGMKKVGTYHYRILKSEGTSAP